MSEWRVFRRRVGYDAFDPGYFVYLFCRVENTRAGLQIVEGDATFDSLSELRASLKDQLKAFKKPVLEYIEPAPFIQEVRK